jgi:putative glutamine amidotransferase
VSPAKPLLGIMSCNRDIGGRLGQVVANRYVEPVLRHVDAAGLIVPAAADPGTATQLADLFDGLLLTGSPSNILPTRYCDEINPTAGPFDDGRDRIVFGLLERLIARGKPVLGICRGLQEINVFFGGSLRCDAASAADLLGHHLPARPGTAFADLFEHRHPVDILPGGMLADLFGARALQVNSVHQQGIDRLGTALRVEARAPDGLVEAISAEVGAATVLGVQWHPEWDLATNPDSQAIFDHFGGLLRGGGSGAHRRAGLSIAAE